jgi:hypothetical protein
VWDRSLGAGSERQLGEGYLSLLQACQKPGAPHDAIVAMRVLDRLGSGCRSLTITLRALRLVPLGQLREKRIVEREALRNAKVAARAEELKVNTYTYMTKRAAPVTRELPRPIVCV